MKPTLGIATAVLWLALATGCARQDDPAPPAPTDVRAVIVPLEVGNTWWCSYHYLDSTGVEVYTRPALAAVVDSVWLKGARWFLIEEDSGIHGITHYNRNTANGLYRFETDSAGGDTPLLIFKFPAVVGETFSRLGLTVTLTATDRLVTVPAGLFACCLYEGPGFRQYVLPDTGIIRVEFDIDQTIGSGHATLLRYDLDSLRLE